MIRAEGDHNIVVGITHGDINGIGYEVIMKSLNDQRILEMFTPVVYGLSKAVSYHRKTLNMTDFNFNIIKGVEYLRHHKPNIVNIHSLEVKIDLGMSTEKAGEMAFLSLEAAVQDLKRNRIDALVTAPINKKSIQSAAFDFPGHTEYLSKRFETSDYLMLMISDQIKIGAITGHVPIKEVSGLLTEDLILQKIRILHESLIKDFAVLKPRIALLGLNPHSGDDGLLGEEENSIIIPSIKKAFEKDMLAYGPFPADGFFGSGGYKDFDAVLAMYHDQAMMPFKILSFEKGVNFTAGLPVIRTSPAHGTAFDIAGKNSASPDSFRSAIYLALDIIRNNRMHQEISQNPLKIEAIEDIGSKPEQ